MNQWFATDIKDLIYLKPELRVSWFRKDDKKNLAKICRALDLGFEINYNIPGYYSSNSRIQMDILLYILADDRLYQQEENYFNSHWGLLINSIERVYDVIRVRPQFLKYIDWSIFDYERLKALKPFKSLIVGFSDIDAPQFGYEFRHICGLKPNLYILDDFEEAEFVYKHYPGDQFIYRLESLSTEYHLHMLEDYLKAGWIFKLTCQRGFESNWENIFVLRLVIKHRMLFTIIDQPIVKGIWSLNVRFCRIVREYTNGSTIAEVTLKEMACHPHLIKLYRKMEDTSQ